MENLRNNFLFLNKLNKLFFYSLLSVFINLLINYRFFLGQYFFSGDNPNIALNTITKAYPVTFINDYNILSSFRVEETPRILFHNFLWFISDFFGLSYSAELQVLMIIIPWIVIGSVYTFLLSESISKSKIIGLLSSIFYINSSFFISSIYMGHLLFLVANSLFSALLYYYNLDGFHKSSFKKFLFIILISSFFDFRFIVSYFLFFYLSELFKFIFNKNIKPLIFLTKTFIIFLFLNLYWIVPEVLLRNKETLYLQTQAESSIYNVNLLDRGYFTGTNNNIIYSILNQHPYIGLFEFHYFSSQDYQILFIVVFFAIIFVLYELKVSRFINEKHKIHILSIMFSYIFFIFLSKVNSQPISNFYSLLNESVRFFTSIFRDGTRFYPLITLLNIYFISYYFLLIRSKKILFYTSIILYFLLSVYYVHHTSNYDFKNANLREFDRNTSVIFDYKSEGTILFFEKKSSIPLYFGGLNNRILIFEEFKKNFNLEIEILCTNIEDYQSFIKKYDIKYIVYTNDNPISKECLRNFDKIHLSDIVSENFSFYQGVIPTSVFYNQDFEPLNFYKTLNFLYSIELTPKYYKIWSSVYFHPSWLILDVDNFTFINYSKNEVAGISFINSSQNENTKYYLIFYPQLIFYLLIGIYIIVFFLIFLKFIYIRYFFWKR